jgi:hypothetical protein
MLHASRIKSRRAAFYRHFTHQARLHQVPQIVVCGGPGGSRVSSIHRVKNFRSRGMPVAFHQECHHGIALRSAAQPASLQRALNTRTVHHLFRIYLKCNFIKTCSFAGRWLIRLKRSPNGGHPSLKICAHVQRHWPVLGSRKTFVRSNHRRNWPLVVQVPASLPLKLRLSRLPARSNAPHHYRSRLPRKRQASASYSRISRQVPRWLKKVSSARRKLPFSLVIFLIPEPMRGTVKLVAIR